MSERLNRVIAYILDKQCASIKNNPHLIFTNFQNYTLSDYKNKNYLYQKKNFSKNYSINFSEYFFNNWYRNDKGKDIFQERISFAKILNKYLFFSLLNDIKNYYALKEYSKKYDKIIIISSNESLIRVSKYFKNLIVKKISSDKVNFIPATPERKDYFFFKKNKTRKFVFELDKYLFKSFKQNKIFLMKDWTTHDSLKNTKNIFIANSPDFRKSFYWNFNQKEKHNFSFNYDQKIFKYSYKILKLFFKSDAVIIHKLFKNLFNDHYKSNIKFINQIANIIINTFDTYKPAGLILFSNYDWLSILISEICKMKNIKTFVLLDGYYLFSSKIDFPKDENNISNFFDYHFSYGPFFKTVLQNNNIKVKKIIDIKIPFLKKNNFKKVKLYDACILGYDPYIYNLNTTWDNQILTELSILNILQKLNYKNVVLKIKMGAKKKKDSQKKSIYIYKKMFKKIYKKSLDLSFDIKEGEFSKILEESKLVIGGLSTAYLESCFYNVPYYIFEPEKNGIYNLDMILPKSNVIRLEKNLVSNLREKNWKRIDVKELFTGKELSKINFKKYI